MEIIDLVWYILDKQCSIIHYCVCTDPTVWYGVMSASVRSWPKPAVTHLAVIIMNITTS
jgi:hypothetical protein